MTAAGAGATDRRTSPGSRQATWTTYADVVTALRCRWDRGEWLGALASGADWEPVSVPLRGPTAGELNARFGAAQDWVAAWERVPVPALRLEGRQVGGRAVGVNTVPGRAWVDTREQLWRLLRVEGEVRRFGRLLDETGAHAPELLGWMSSHPLRVLDLAADWPRLVATVLFVDALGGRRIYLRQVDVPGVDTKFIERHRGVLATLLDARLPDDRIERLVPPSDFARRYRFQAKPTYVRLRSLAGSEVGVGVRAGLAGSFSEVTVRVEELAAASVDASTVVVVENEITYLALPPASGTVAVLGGGYAVSKLLPLTWLHDRSLLYWGDLDTHGFAILHQLRRCFGHTRSLLMDRATLLDHETHWVREPAPTRARLDLLTRDERELYDDLVGDAFGPSVRLEQERIAFHVVESALAEAIVASGGARRDSPIG